MYKKQRPDTTSLNINESYEGETIEQKVRRILSNKEPISDNAPLIYTERKQGVQPGYNIRTDRFEIAIEAMDKVTKTHITKRENLAKLGEEAKAGMIKEGNETGGQSIQGTETQAT